jgi:hypothetical protein
METPDTFTFPGYMHVLDLAHDPFGPELFFFMREELQDALFILRGIDKIQSIFNFL